MARTTGAIQSDIDAAYAARTQIIAGEQVKEVWRDGRRLVFQTMTLKDVNALISSLELEMEGAKAQESGSRRRRSISMVYSN